MHWHCPCRILAWITEVGRDVRSRAKPEPKKLPLLRPMEERAGERRCVPSNGPSPHSFLAGRGMTRSENLRSRRKLLTIIIQPGEDGTKSKRTSNFEPRTLNFE